MINQDTELLTKVYFGTPHLSYRRRLLKMAGENFKLPESQTWSNSKDPKQIFDLTKAASEDGAGALIEGSLPHQLLILLASDLYRPTSIGSAFNALFHGEHFGQQGSANRVSQLVMKLRKTFEAADVGLQIVETRGQYRLQLAEGWAIRLTPEVPKISREDLTWLKFKSELPAEAFSRADFERVTQYSPAKAKRLLRWALDHEQIRSIGYGPNTKYQFAA